ncbi:interphotoreceptor matrix proteoglycan 1-like isoform X4 [Phyllopteryx taeniolatus]|uniref:interphotoreceptor matrix proteoglycan 1-like isoform X4 n=1 Tax=Phyllopteryx taeniolatus TaxID=161469 RepID=UPI002AD2A835|nr:interphotoreceptor matrix proteoglycan 1-like isoform X4 [Phyllopteryx taeniolatus]
MLWALRLLPLLVLAWQVQGRSAPRDSGLKEEAVSPSVSLASFLKTSPPSGLGKRRSKRSVFLHSGVRVCPQESVSEVLASHRSYYQLRVCQEAVWEAYRIFLDRIPGTSEYQRWVHACQREALCIADIARNFSNSEEHLHLIHVRMKRLRNERPPSRALLTPSPVTHDTREVLSTTALLHQATSSPGSAPDQQWTAMEDVEEDSDIPNVVPESPAEQRVAFSIDLVDPGYRELLDDPDSPQYIDLAHHLQDQMQHVFDKLPGFKSIRVLRISETQDADSVGGITVHYSLVFEITSPETRSEAADATPTASADSKLREMVRKALQDDASLPVDLESLYFDPGDVLPAPTLSSLREPGVEASEANSNNEFEVFLDDPEVDKIRPQVPLSPSEKENALVTLLDLSDEEDLRFEPDALEPSSEEEELIISHKIETFHHAETGELVRDYTPSPPTMADLDLMSEDNQTPTTHISLTSSAADRPLGSSLVATTLSAARGQMSTEPTEVFAKANSLTDLGVHAPIEDSLELGPESATPLRELAVKPAQEVLEVLDRTSVTTEVYELQGENVYVPEEETMGGKQELFPELVDLPLDLPGTEDKALEVVKPQGWALEGKSDDDVVEQKGKAEEAHDMEEERFPETEVHVQNVSHQNIIPDVSQETTPTLLEEPITVVSEEHLSDVLEEAQNVVEEMLPGVTGELLPDVVAETLDVPEETLHGVPTELLPKTIDVFEKPAPTGSTTIKEKMVDVPKPEAVAVVTTPRDSFVDSEEALGATKAASQPEPVLIIEENETGDKEVAESQTPASVPEHSGGALVGFELHPVGVEEETGYVPESETEEEMDYSMKVLEAGELEMMPETKGDEQVNSAEPKEETIDTPEPNEEETIDILEAVLEHDTTESQAESIPVFAPFDKEGDLLVVDNTGEEDAGELKYPIIDNLLSEVGSNGVHHQVGLDINAAESAKTSIEPADMTPSDRGAASQEDLLEEAKKDFTLKSDASVRAIPEKAATTASDSSAAPATTSAAGFSSHGQTVDFGLFEVAEPRDQSAPSIIIIEEDMKEAENQMSRPVAAEDVVGEAVRDLAEELDQADLVTTDPPDEGSGFFVAHTSDGATAPPTVRYLTTPTMTTATHGRELVVFFSLRVTNMDFSEDLFNKTSPEYRTLENTFLDVLLPYLQANLTGFRNLEILNFRKGSVVVNSRMKLAKSVPYNITEAVQCVLRDFCSTAAALLHIDIDSRSLDVEPADRADPCKFLGCGVGSRCVPELPRSWRSGEARCQCEPGFLSADGLPCRSVCELRPGRCGDGAVCHVEPGRGAVCRSKGSERLLAA